MQSEWTRKKKWNPFNSYKLLTQVPRWEYIQRGKPKPPILVTIDPTNKCNLNCVWCNAKAVRKNENQIEPEYLSMIAELLGGWGVEAVCVAGGGEPTQHDRFGDLIDWLMQENIRIGVVTNGTRIDDFQQMFTFCDWVGVSIDAGTERVYQIGKGSDEFKSVVDQCLRLIKIVEGTGRALNGPGLGNGVFYKFLIHPENAGDIFNAVIVASQLGFKAIHYRPVGTTWDNLNSDWEIVFSEEMIVRINAHLRNAMTLDSDNFSVYGVTHKFTNTFQPCHNFEKCWAVYMTAVFMPPTTAGEGFNLGLCCDRRGDRSVLALEDVTRITDVINFWGSDAHKAIAASIKPAEQCPRCTYAPHNEIFEKVILEDNMTHDFI